MAVKIFIINGKGGSGKDTFVNFVKEEVGKLQVLNISSVDQIKQAAKILGWDGSKDLSSRKFLSDLKDLSTKYNNGPFEYVSSLIKSAIRAKIYKAVFVHIREPKEIEKIRTKFDSKAILISRDTKIEDYGNYGDDNVDYYDYDIVVNNSLSLEALKEIVKRFVKIEINC